MNLEQARFNMIEQQIRPWEVLDTQVLTLLATVKRDPLLEVTYRTLKDAHDNAAEQYWTTVWSY